MIYVFNIVKEYDDIYIEVKKYLYGEVRMTIDAKKIIPKLSVPLEDEEKLKEIRNWEALIRETYGSIITAVGEFTHSAARILKSKTTDGMWKGWEIKRGVWNHYYVSYSEEFEPILLPRAAFKDEL